MSAEITWKNPCEVGPVGLCMVCFMPREGSGICATCGDPGSVDKADDQPSPAQQSFLQLLRDRHVCAKHRTTQSYADCSKCFLPQCADCLFFSASKKNSAGPYCLVCLRMATIGNQVLRKTFVAASDLDFQSSRRKTGRTPKSFRIWWRWLWFAPLSLFLLFFVETHTIQFGLVVIRLAIKRWTWGGLISPSAYICMSAIIASILYPVYGLIFALASLSDDAEQTKQRYLRAALAISIVIILPLVSDALIWGSFPFAIDAAGLHRLRIIPFFPWPSGGYGAF